MTRLVTQVTSLVLDMVVLDRQEDRLFDEVQVFPEEEEVHDLSHPETTRIIVITRSRRRKIRRLWAIWVVILLFDPTDVGQIRKPRAGFICYQVMNKENKRAVCWTNSSKVCVFEHGF